MCKHLKQTKKGLKCAINNTIVKLASTACKECVNYDKN